MKLEPKQVETAEELASFMAERGITAEAMKAMGEAERKAMVIEAMLCLMQANTRAGDAHMHFSAADSAGYMAYLADPVANAHMIERYI